MRFVLLLVGLGVGLIVPAQADQQGDALAWLQKMAVAAKKLNYTGTFTYQSGDSSETSRITHVVDAGGEQEKLEVLDGSPREVVRHNDEIKCFLPEDKIVIVETRGQQKSFPALLPAAVGSLGDHYAIRLGEVSRVAGLESQMIMLEPKDALRYGHHLWADIQSGLILKARTLNERSETIEQFVFTQLQINSPIDKEQLKPKFGAEGSAWRVHNARALQSLSAGGDWHFRTQLPGFRKSSGMRRQTVRGGGMDTTHFIFTDGLASISIFIEPLADQSVENATFSVGAINVYKRVAGRYLLTVLGEVPMATLKRLGDGMESRKK